MNHARDEGAEVITFGCRLNAFESEIIRREAREAGLDDVIVVNTCAVTGEAVRQARQAIRQARRARPEARIVVTGCAAQIAPAAFAEMREVTQVIGNEEKRRIADHVPPPHVEAPQIKTPRIAVGEIGRAAAGKPPFIDALAGRSRAFLEIQNGCDHRCTFCVIPHGRGPSRSVRPAHIVEQARRLVRHGHKEIVLTGVDITAYGADLPERPRLGDLCVRILEGVPALARLRLSSIDAVEADPRLRRLIAEEPRLMPHLHLSLQSGDDLVLKRMGRRHSRADAVSFCAEMRALRPEIVFGADLIAGFPTETEEMASRSESLIEACGLTYLHVFPFSPREGTAAARMPALDRTTVRARARRLREAGEKALVRYLESRIGETVSVLVETPGEGRTEAYARVALDRRIPAGAIVRARITGRRDCQLEAQPIDRAA